MAVAVQAQTAKAAHPAAGTQARGLARPEGMSPGAQALAPKKPSAFLQLFRKIVGAGRKASAGALQAGAEAETSSGQAARARTRASETGEFAARAGRRPRRGGEGWLRQAAPRTGSRRAWDDASLEAAAAPIPASARLPRASAPQEALVPATEGGRAPRPAQARVFVVDLRTRSTAEGERPGIRRESAAPERAPRSFERAMLAREFGNASPDLTTPPSSSPTSLSGRSLAQPAFAPTPGLPGALRERLLPEIVHQAGIVLRDGGEGEIRLVLKPEHLGSVRIRLQLGESSLEGRIVVDNSNVKELLEANLEQLKSALRQEGWASASIDVTVSGGGRRQEQPETALPAAAGRTAGEFERAVPAMLDLGFTAVNLLI